MTLTRKTIIFLCIVPVLLVAVYSYIQIRKNTIESLYEDLRSFATLSARVLQEKLDRLSDLGLALATRPVFCQYVEEKKWDEAIALMEQVPMDFTYIDHITITDNAGTLMADLPASAGARGQSHSQVDWFKGLTRNWRPYLSEVYVRNKNIVTSLACPVKNKEGKVLCILVLRVRVAELLEWSKGVSIGKSGFLFIVDHKGHIAANPKYELTDSIIDYSSVPAVQKALRGEKNVEVLYNPIEKENRLSAFEQIPGYDWAVIVQKQAGTALSPDKSLTLISVIYLFAILLAIAFAYFIIREMNLRTKAQGALQKTSDEIKYLYNNAPCGYLSVDADILLSNINQTLLNWLGYIHEEVIGRMKYEDLLSAESKAAFLRSFEKDFEEYENKGSVSNLEFEFQRKDGTTFPVIVNSEAIMDEKGKFVKSLSTVFDNTERKKAEVNLQESLKKIADYKYALDESNIVAITDQKGIIKYVNDNFSKISRYSKDELLGQDHRIINSGFHPKEFIRDLWVTIANGEVWRGELRNKAKDGTIYWVDTTIVPFLNEQGKPYQYVAIRSDITERKKKETEIQNLNKELESFSYSVSHDLRAPLRALEGFGKALSEKYKDTFDEDASRWLGFITSNAKQMDLLINDMLNFSRINRENVKGTIVNMKVLAQECFETNKMHYSGKNISFTLANIPDSFGDVAMVKQVWQNLISNALKYSSKNENITIDITGKIEHDYTVYSIKDNGVGFDEKYKNKLFGVFQRLHSNKEFEGTGVGLAIVDRIIQKHNGWIRASSQTGKGAEFTFALPVENKFENNS
ncbi:MAG: PAS domain-containing protein [Bacteroidota bacterium]